MNSNDYDSPIEYQRGIKNRLSPIDTKMVLDVILGNCSGIFSPEHFISKSDLKMFGGDGVVKDRYIYKFDFITKTQESFETLYQTVASIVRPGMDGDMADGVGITDDNVHGAYLQANQLFKPKLNIEVKESGKLMNAHASLNCHLRNDPKGRVLLQADYLDVIADTLALSEFEIMERYRKEQEAEEEKWLAAHPDFDPDDDF